ncbi:type III polyketide synthase [Leucobacter rhizosphaerae]|uniref:type III polyketide synthase n=1 Tax=Leucobacter rhizosphaerae TaxID=2932245 RepID=UPI0021123737|nr:type III polyketide synthase [Leucobacter rhizosphaerae]
MPPDRSSEERGAVSIRSIGTAVPPTVLEQPRVAELFSQQPGTSRLAQRLIASAFGASAIDRRHTVIPELDGEARPDPVFVDVAAGSILSPSTGTRNEVYVREVRPLLREAAEAAIAAASGLERGDITHVITVSCTGFMAPGPEYLLVRDLGLAPSTRRLHVGFMGCYGAFPALRAAVSTCVAEPDAVVLIVCVELCSLHLRTSEDPDTIVASSVFADGAAAAIVSARPAPAGETVLDVDRLDTTLTATGEAEMAWTIGDLGFEMVLSNAVPRILEEQIDEALRPLLEAGSSSPPEEGWAAIRHWAIHPGGRAILDRVQRALDLTDRQLAPSREILRSYGNMSSATVLFILQRILTGSENDPEPELDPAPDASDRVLAVAFGPGLTVESGLFTRRVVS